MLAALTFSSALTFAFANAKGDRLLGLATGDDAAGVSGSKLGAVCGGGELLTVVAKGAQKRGKEDTGRDWAQNFAQRAGPLFAVEKGKAKDNASCLVFGADFAQAKDLMTVTPPPSGQSVACEPALVERIKAAHAGWTLANCNVSARIGGKSDGDAAGVLVLAVFKAKPNKDVLASLAWAHGSVLSMRDLSAQMNETTTWRVDDGGEIAAASFRVVGAFKRAGGATALAIEWGAFEGADLTLSEEKGGKLVSVARAARYWSPG
jgi:hypothetical protein